MNYFSVDKIAEKAVCMSVFLTIFLALYFECRININGSFGLFFFLRFYSLDEPHKIVWYLLSAYRLYYSTFFTRCFLVSM